MKIISYSVSMIFDGEANMNHEIIEDFLMMLVKHNEETTNDILANAIANNVASQNVIEEFPAFQSIQTFKEAGETMDNGVVISLADGTEIFLTIQTR